MYEIKYKYNGQENKDGKFSIEAARTFARRIARYAGSCEIIDGEKTVETWKYNEEAGRVVQLSQSSEPAPLAKEKRR